MGIFSRLHIARESSATVSNFEFIHLPIRMWTGSSPTPFSIFSPWTLALPAEGAQISALVATAVFQLATTVEFSASDLYARSKSTQKLLKHPRSRSSSGRAAQRYLNSICLSTARARRESKATLSLLLLVLIMSIRSRWPAARIFPRTGLSSFPIQSLEIASPRTRSRSRFKGDHVPLC